MATVTQRAFAAGEVCPALYSRVDQARYATGLRTCRNFLVERAGGVSSRPGTEYVGPASGLSSDMTLIPFVYNDEQTYVLEFYGQDAMRVIKNGEYVLDSSSGKNIGVMTNANPVVVECVSGVSHGFSTGDFVKFSDVQGMVEVNNSFFKVVRDSATQFHLHKMDGSNVDGTSLGSYVSSTGTVSKIYVKSFTGPFAGLATTAWKEVKYTQSADVLTLVHNSYNPIEIKRVADDSWTATSVSFGPTVERPTVAGSATAGADSYQYQVTQVSEALEESLPCYGASVSLASGAPSNPVSIATLAPHGFSNGDEVYIYPINGTLPISDKTFVITVTGASSFTLDGINGTGYVAASSGTLRRPYLRIDSATFPITISARGPAGILEYNIYRKVNGIFGLVGTVPAKSYSGSTKHADFIDTNYTADLTDNPPLERDMFPSATNYPSCATYYQQRLIFANTVSNVEGVWGSTTGHYHNFDYHSPLRDDDSFMFRLAGLKVNAVQNVLGMKNLILFTDGGVWVAQGSGSGIITPTEINAVQHSYHGAAPLHPIIVGESVLYVQSRGSIIRDLAYDYQVDGYRGNDLTTFSTHMVDGYELNEWTYQETPNSIIWAVRDDGTLLGITYIKEQQIIGWHRHDFGTGATVESVCCVPEGNEDALYMVVRRPVPGTTDERNVERMATRQVDDIKDYIGLDCTMTYDGNNTGSGTMAVTSGTTWTHDELLTINSSLSYFASGDVGNEIHLTGSDGEILRFAITQYSSTTQVKGHGHKTVPTSLRSTATLVWAKAVDEVAGLWPHRGKSVAVFADGFVVANPNNANYGTATVTALGYLTLPGHYALVRVGIPITHDLETLDVDTEQGETMQDKRKLITKVIVMVRKSMGFWAGPKPPSDDATDNLEGLTEAKIRSDESYDDPVALKTGSAEVLIGGEWSQGGRVFLRQVDPVPVSIMAVSPSGLIPFRGGK